jgi:uncharacterized protein YggE
MNYTRVLAGLATLTLLPSTLLSAHPAAAALAPVDTADTADAAVSRPGTAAAPLDTSGAAGAAASRPGVGAATSDTPGTAGAKAGTIGTAATQPGSAAGRTSTAGSAGATTARRAGALSTTSAKRQAATAGDASVVRRGGADQPWESVLVTGRGEVSGEPDLLVADFGVETTGPTVAGTLDRANRAAAGMRDALIRAGIAKADLQTSNVNIIATRKDDGPDSGKITGYTVNQGLTAKIRNLPKAGPFLSAAIAAGGDAARLSSVSFVIEDDAALLAEARRKAFADAKAKAALYAREADRPLGRVVKVSETSPDNGLGGERNKMYAAMYAADSSVQIEPGRQQLSVTVTVEWTLGAGK